MDTAFSAQRMYEPRGPLVNSEFYTGWLTHWGETFQRVDTNAIVNTLDEMLARNASVNFFVFYGGTNFGFLAGEFPRLQLRNVLHTSHLYSSHLLSFIICSWWSSLFLVFILFVIAIANLRFRRSFIICTHRILWSDEMDTKLYLENMKGKETVLKSYA